MRPTLDPDEVVRHLSRADHRILLMCAFHLTGDERWLRPPFAPARDSRLVADPTAGLPESVRAELRSAVASALADRAGRPAVADPGNRRMAHMMSVCLGENVPVEYAPMFREDMGFIGERESHSFKVADWDRYDVLIVGAGVSGIALGSELKRAGCRFTVIERNEEVGGTWFENRYPGVGVDTPSHAYSFRTPDAHAWSRYFSLGSEVQRYLIECTDRFGIRDHLRLKTAFIGASWDEESRRWLIDVQGPQGRETLSAAYLVSATGIFSTPTTPRLDGVDSFQGEILHTARWRDHVELHGRRVVVVGTGASAMQLVPAIAPLVKHLTIFQRSPQWVRPVEGYRDTLPENVHWLFDNVPFYGSWFRFSMFWRYGDGLLPSLRRDPEWPHPERAMNRWNDRHREELTNYIEGKLAKRPELIEACTPTYPPYGKRILLDSGWFDALVQKHVDLETAAIDRLVPEGVMTVDGAVHEADVVVFATGFQVTRLAASLDIVGHGGRALSDAWADDNPTAHLGITVPGFPNFFCMLGPNTGLGHGGSSIFQSECQARYIMSCFEAVSERNARGLVVRQDVHDEYVNRVDAEHAELIWTHPGMSTYYRNTRGRVVTVMPWRIVDYWQMTHDVDPKEYEFLP